MPVVTGDDRKKRRELLVRVIEAGVEERFQLRDVCPRDAGTFLGALSWLVDHGFVERVSVRCGVWYLRLSAEAVACVKEGRPLVYRKGYPDRDSDAHEQRRNPRGQRILRAESDDARDYRANRLA